MTISHESGNANSSQVKPELSGTGTSRLVPIYHRRGLIAAYAIVDAADLPLVDCDAWRLHSGGYAVKDGNRTLMHRVILGLSHGDRSVVDHRNHNRLDNRRGNIRVCSPSANSLNRLPGHNNHSGVVGVCWKGDRWWARLQIDGKCVHYSRHHSMAEAVAARRDAERVAGLLPAEVAHV
jgi:hypothetical protein